MVYIYIYINIPIESLLMAATSKRSEFPLHPWYWGIGPKKNNSNHDKADLVL